uniref:KIB1-4 beta-propeller domain-containing protein n=1 Tax=Solanum tuberosum TaxID=4113 RepID=M1CTD8_SOLTU
MVHHNGADSFLAFWRSEDLDWTHIDVVNHAVVIISLVYHKGEFYSMSYSGKVRAYEVAGPNVKTRLVGEIDENTFNSRVIEYYLVELSGALLL